MSVETINTLKASCDEAIVAGDFSAALGYAERAQLVLAMMPDTRLSSAELRWSRDAIAAAVKLLKGKVNSGGGRGRRIEQTKIRWKRPGV